MRSNITPLQSRVEISHVRDVQVSQIVDDGSGGFVRALRIFGAPEGACGPAPVLEVLIRSQTRGDLDITTPELSF